MPKATLTLKSTAFVSKLDATPWSRELWRAAYAMARRMIRDRATRGVGAAYTWYLNHARERFGASGWRVSQAAGSLAFALRAVAYAASGSIDDLERQGLVRRTAKPRRGNLCGVVAHR